MTRDLRWVDRMVQLVRRTESSTASKTQLDKPLTHDQLKAIEDQYGFTVPSDYRSFLMNTGTAGDGPGHGLWPLGYWDPSDHQIQVWSDGSWADEPGKPFPHAAAWNLPPDLVAETPPADAPWDDHDAFAERMEPANWQASLSDGAIPIAHLGCAIRLLLVVTGPEHGTVWIDDRANDGGIYPAQTEHHPRRMTFADL